MLPEINNGSVPLSASQSLFLCSAVRVFHAPSACSPVSPGLTGPAIKPHVDWLGRCADIPRCDPAPLPLLLTAPGLSGCAGWGGKGLWSKLWVVLSPLSVWPCSRPRCDVLHGRLQPPHLASPVPGRVCRCPVLTEGATLHGDSRPWTQKPL